MTLLRALLLGAAAACAVPSWLRWLRVAQREHYLPGAGARFAWRWWTGSPVALVEIVIALAGAAASFAPGRWVAAGLLTTVALAAGPPGLSVRGRTSPLSWTRRLRVLATATAFGLVVPVAIAAAAGGLRWAAAAAVVVAVAVPLVVDVAAAVLSPVENRLADRFVTAAAARLRRVAPSVVAITGSYGKTTTKGYVAHLASARFAVVASPRSFNNRAGLARTVNDLLEPHTEVFVAEMGTYGPGEIAALCAWIPPTVAVITAIGPVHLERFKTLERTLDAKSEIVANAAYVVLNVDDVRLAALAAKLRAVGRAVVGCSAADRAADVAVVADGKDMEVYFGGTLVGRVTCPDGGPPPALPNVACAVGAAVSLGCDCDDVVARLGDLPGATNRLETTVSPGGVVILDDTFNSNPAGAALALGVLSEVATEGARRAVVTPGMVELGSRQRDENATFARRAAEVADDLVIVGRTNRRALLSGAGHGGAAVVRVRDRAGAVDWVRTNLGAGDVVLYENDLPDHYP